MLRSGDFTSLVLSGGHGGPAWLSRKAPLPARDMGAPGLQAAEGCRQFCLQLWSFVFVLVIGSCLFEAADSSPGFVV